MDQNPRQQIIDRLKEANNVLVTVSANPSVDQLAACIGFTLILNKLGKHGTAVFSGQVPSTIEFLKPDDTLEKNTDSLRDFIIALDKAKADKLRYKVEDKVVKIFITPYRTSLSDKDLDFSQGDFNVDAVIALGVHERTDLDQAITSHGRILHDATVISVNNKDQGNLGAINWVDLNASSLSEMLVELARGLTTDPMDGQMATAFMTGIVAETDRFSNTKTSPRTMALASELMAAGANQQLIASKLQAAQPIPSLDGSTAANVVDSGTEPDADGSLRISHQEILENPEPEIPAVSEDKFDSKADDSEDIASLLGVSENTSNSPIISHTAIGQATDLREPSANDEPAHVSRMTLQPPTMGGQLTANSRPEHLQLDPSTDPLSLPSLDQASTAMPQLLNRPVGPASQPLQPLPTVPAVEPPVEATPTVSEPAPLDDLPTLSNLEAEVGSPHLNEVPQPADSSNGEEVEEAREAVDEAISSEAPSRPLEPIAALGAQPLGADLGNDNPIEPTLPPSPISFPSTTPDPTVPQMPATPNPFGAPPDANGVNPNNPSVPASIMPPSQPMDTTGTITSPTAPPPVPPPLMPPYDGSMSNPAL